MIKFKAQRKSGRELVGLGLSEENLERLRSGKPIHIFSEEVGMEGSFELMLFYGRTEEEMQESLKEFIGPQTKTSVGVDQ